VKDPENVMETATEITTRFKHAKLSPVIQPDGQNGPNGASAQKRAEAERNFANEFVPISVQTIEIFIKNHETAMFFDV
jgi:hypothetical protein